VYGNTLDSINYSKVGFFGRLERKSRTDIIDSYPVVLL